MIHLEYKFNLNQAGRTFSQPGSKSKSNFAEFSFKNTYVEDNTGLIFDKIEEKRGL